MTDQTPPPPAPDATPVPPPPPAYDPAGAGLQPSAPPAPPAYGAPVPMMGPGPLGKVRPTGISMLLFVVTLGIYGYVWFFKVHEEMKAHTGRGIGGLVAFLLQFFVGVITPFFTASEIGDMQELSGQKRTVSGVTGLWYFPGMLILVGPIIWFVKVNGALNDYWQSQGAPAA